MPSIISLVNKVADKPNEPLKQHWENLPGNGLKETAPEFLHLMFDVALFRKKKKWI